MQAAAGGVRKGAGGGGRGGAQRRLARPPGPRRGLHRFLADGSRQGAALAAEHGVAVTFVEADVHAWDYPEAAFDVVAEIFTQFSPPEGRALKWAGMRRALKPGGLLIVVGYTPKQLAYGTGGPKQVENLYTRALLEEAFGDFADLSITEEETELQEGSGHSGMSAVIGLTGRKR